MAAVLGIGLAGPVGAQPPPGPRFGGPGPFVAGALLGLGAAAVVGGAIPPPPPAYAAPPPPYPYRYYAGPPWRAYYPQYYAGPPRGVYYPYYYAGPPRRPYYPYPYYYGYPHY